MRRPARTPAARLPAALALVVAVALAACGRPAPPAPLFERLTPEATGVAFRNDLPEAPAFNILNYLYYYNGGGVAAGDVDGDGRVDLYFTSNLGPNRLYRNLGGFRFEDVTARAGVAGPPGWKSGVTMADVDGDGRLDIYVSAVDHLGERGRNALYANNGDGTFTDRTAEYGLDFAGYGTQAAFFDYDGDGDLDAYLLNHSVHSERTIRPRPHSGPRNPRSDDRLLRNDRDARGRPHFTDVSARAGLLPDDGFGLGVVASDVNLDGCPDLYVAVDFQEDDLLYLNRCDGTFAESLAAAAGHTSRFSMGVDAADVNDDGRPDVFVGDMLPEREDVLKTSASSESFNLFNLRLRAGYRPQYARNTLQLNRGAAAPGGVPRFADVGYLAGVHATDWSWAPLFADLDNDGRKDLFVANGIYRRPNDLDYINYVGNETAQAALARGDAGANLEVLRHMPQVPIPNHAFRNDGGLKFTDVAERWGLAEPGFSNGAAYADLDDDGALDLVVNRVNAPAAVYRNRARARDGRAAAAGSAGDGAAADTVPNRYLTVALRGAGANTAGVGAKVFVAAGGATQLLEQSPTRGFQSSVDPRLHFGLGRLARVDSLTVVWPDRRYQVLRGVAADRAVTLSQADASGRYDYAAAARAARPPAPMFADSGAGATLDFAHAENDVLDTDRDPLVPHLLSNLGPALAAGDVDGDGLDDLFVGGAKWQPGRLALQQPDGTFRPSPQPAVAADSLAEDVDAAFLDADGDGDQDLVVAAAGNEFWGAADALRPRLYLNDGRGAFARAPAAFPGVYANAGCVVPGDFDGDGRVDLFVGGRVVPREYGRPARSYLLRNAGGGRFDDVTARLAPARAEAGMVASAAWLPRADAGPARAPRLDLVVAGEWMPVRVFRQEGGRFADRTAEAGLAGTEGWWNSVTAADLDGDGRQDLVLGNLGLNAYVKASAAEPARLYVADFFSTGASKPVLTFYKNGVSYPLAGRDELVRLMPPLRSRYPSYKAFGASRVDEIFPADELRRARVLEARQLASGVAMQGADGRFAFRPLPTEAQLAPVYAALAADFDGDGRRDLLLGGNQHGVPPVLGRYDASDGLVLRGLGAGRFAAVDREAGGVAIDGQVRHLRLLRAAGGARLVAIARNDDRPVVLRVLGTGAPAGAATLARAAAPNAAAPAARGLAR